MINFENYHSNNCSQKSKTIFKYSARCKLVMTEQIIETDCLGVKLFSREKIDEEKINPVNKIAGYLKVKIWKNKFSTTKVKIRL